MVRAALVSLLLCARTSALSVGGGLRFPAAPARFSPSSLRASAAASSSRLLELDDAARERRAASYASISAAARESIVGVAAAAQPAALARALAAPRAEARLRAASLGVLIAMLASAFFVSSNAGFVSFTDPRISAAISDGVGREIGVAGTALAALLSTAAEAARSAARYGQPIATFRLSAMTTPIAALAGIMSVATALTPWHTYRFQHNLYALGFFASIVILMAQQVRQQYTDMFDVADAARPPAAEQPLAPALCTGSAAGVAAAAALRAPPPPLRTAIAASPRLTAGVYRTVACALALVALGVTTTFARVGFEEAVIVWCKSRFDYDLIRNHGVKAPPRV